MTAGQAKNIARLVDLALIQRARSLKGNESSLLESARRTIEHSRQLVRKSQRLLARLGYEQNPLQNPFLGEGNLRR